MQNKPNQPVYNQIDLILAAMGILLALYAVWYSVAQYQHIFGHKPY